ncbi:uncharacterized protein LOC123716510 [Pieris brassicae]|uniref:uncharacterized protein LOC123716510 n=1 Tax=Pieris brassicae TaxID=7116 RepID=UPI001E660529|nr:uncharacterized protein LOC123716510 [Pieris brassicae]
MSRCPMQRFPYNGSAVSSKCQGSVDSEVFDGRRRVNRSSSLRTQPDSISLPRSHDGKQPTYIFTPRYPKSSKETALYILDCLFSVTVIGSLVVVVWGGLWGLIDIYLYPDDPVKSCWMSLIVGYSMVFVTFSLQAPMRWVVARLQGAPRLVIADVYHFLSFASTVNVWRAVWGFLDIYFLPDSPLLSNWSCHVVSLALLILLNCSNSILVRGVYIDAEEPAGECVIFSCHYLRHFFQKERTERHKPLDLTKKREEASVPLGTPEEKV